MAQEPKFAPTPFPLATKVGEIFTHPVTGQIYVYGGNTKRSWRLTSDIENRTYTGPSAPDELIENLKNGDLWWDNEHFELRVYHKVPLDMDENTKDVTYSEGVWVSSTHPMMDPDEPEKQKQFGKIICTPLERIFTEGSEFKFQAHLPYHNVPFDQWKVSARVSPTYLGDDPNNPSQNNNVSIDFDPDTGEIYGSLLLGYYPIGDATLERLLKVNITVEAYTDLEGEEAEAFYEGFYQTSTTGGFLAEIEYLPTHPPLVVDTIPFKEQLSDTVKGTIMPGYEYLMDLEEYQQTANETIRFVPLDNTDPSLGFELISRADGRLLFTGNPDEYPLSTQLPNVAMAAKHQGAKQLVIMFRYGQSEDELIAENYKDKEDNYGTIRETWQTEYLGYNNVKGVMDNMRIAFFVDGEDDESIETGAPLYTTRFADMGIVTKYTIDQGSGPVSIEGQFIGLILDASNTSELKEIPETGQRRLYFACLKPSALEPTNSVADIHPSTKGYIDIEAFTPAGT